MRDVLAELRAIRRTVGEGKLTAGPARSITLRRTYQAGIEDVWDAVTEPERIARWFLPVSGDFRVGGRYQIEGNAGGEILQCEPPRMFRVTSIYGEAPPDSSVVEVRLTEVGDDETELELEHTAVVDPSLWETYGPGAVGIGWDLTMLGLGLYTNGESIEDRTDWGRSDEARAFMAESSEQWRIAHEASGAPADEAAAAAHGSLNFYLPPPTP